MKKLFSLIAAVLFAGSMMAAESVAYTLTYANAEGGGNSYATNYDITINDVDWSVPGNTTMNPVRIGGKGDAVRVLYSKTALADNITKVIIEHGTANLTVNSVTLKVYATAEEAASGENPISTVDGGTFEASSTMTFARPEAADWTGRFYRIEYNVSAAGTKNKYVEFVKADFYKHVADIEATGITLNKTDLALEQYREEALIPTLAPEGATTAVTWESSDPTVAVVTEAGLVKAIKVGTATITAKAGESVSTTCAVTVSEPTVLTCTDAAAKAATLEHNNDLYEGGQYVVEGYAISTNTSTGFIWIVDDKNAENGTFEVYKPTNTSDIADVVAGDKIRAIGYITKYNTTYEFAAGCVFEVVTEPATTKYCEFATGHLGQADFGDANGRILLTIQKIKDTNNIRVAIKNNSAAGNTKEGLNYLWVNLEGAAGVVRYGDGTHAEADVEEVSVIIELDEAKESYNFINIHWAYSGWEGEWAIDGLTVAATELCDTEYIPTAIDNTVVSEKAIKMFENGQLIIIKNGVKYNALGSVIE